MLSFMGNEFAQFIEWRDYEELEWFLLQNATHAGVQAFIRELNHVYRAEKALWEIDNSWDGFDWIDADNNEQGILSFVRKAKDGSAVLCVLNFRPESHESFRLGVPLAGAWQEILSSDDMRFGGSGKTNPRRLHTKKIPSHGRDASLVLTVPPLGGTLIKYIGETTHARKRRV